MIIHTKDNSGWEIPFELLFENESCKYNNIFKIKSFRDKSSSLHNIIMKIDDYTWGCYPKIELFVDSIDHSASQLRLKFNETSNEALLSYFWVNPKSRNLGHGHILLKCLKLCIKLYNIKILSHNIQLANYNLPLNVQSDFYKIMLVDTVRLHANSHEEDTHKKLSQSELVSFYERMGFVSIDNTDYPEMYMKLW